MQPFCYAEVLYHSVGDDSDDSDMTERIMERFFPVSDDNDAAVNDSDGAMTQHYGQHYN